ncbi:uncharacterized protein N7479_009791 [Penicillium vulpinum]|uniref:F-box domain-containing protein n=1 Tax=Penicillium vulpinum TaxID=29845 RepID=A0A1V6RXW0_9EURO|nr:uncharacterized protein N7479_009791 [Penicillium vulpinum]KAJ5951378.1 hypothetical protein N7479_009791 [Penicillium vulpinum]OQE06607.1 hypothetical protein PENVUL_c017G03865 [Penicillium vulpinum]
MGFSALPLEMIYLIAEYLELESDINALSRTTRQLHNLLNKYLYKHNVKHNGGCALEWAARHGRTSVAQKSLEAGALLYATVNESMQPICLASAHGHDAVVKIFLEWGVCPNGEKEWWPKRPWPLEDEPFENYFTGEDLLENFDFDAWLEDSPVNGDQDPIILAIRYGHESVIQLLRAHGGMANWDQDKASEALTTAVEGGNLEIVKTIAREYPETMSYLVREKRRLLSLAKKTEIASFLVNAGVPLDGAEPGWLTPLSCAVESSNVDLIRFLVESGACPTHPWPHGVTLWLMRRAAQNFDGQDRSLEVVQYLLSHVDVDSKINAGGEDMIILLLVAATCDFEEIIEKILKTGCHPDTTAGPCPEWFGESRTALSWAVQRGNVRIARLLLEKGADPNKLKEREETPLIVACETGNIDMVVLLLEHDVDLNCKNKHRDPALVTAIPFPELFSILLERTADSQVAFDHDELNLMEIAVRSGNVAMVQMLLDRGFSLERPRGVSEVTTMVSQAVRGGVAMLEFLRPYGVVPVAGNAEAQIALRCAIRAGHTLVTKYLLDQGFDPNPTASELPSFTEHPASYLGDAANAGDPQAAAATLDVLLSHGANIDKLDTFYASRRSVGPFMSEGQLTVLRLLLERGASPLPEHKFGSSALKVAVKANSKEAIDLLLSFTDVHSLSLNDLHRNLLLAEGILTEWDKWHLSAARYTIRLWRQLYWRKRHPVPA